jgi:tetratricopeptide (TPR) repeat protein
MLRSVPFLVSAAVGLAEPASDMHGTVDVDALAPYEATASESAAPVTTASLQTVRWGRTASGATRVVFQLDRGVEFLTVELAEENGIEIHLIGAELGPTREPLVADGQVVRDVVLRPDPNGGTVARIRSAGPRLSAKTFTLENPTRVVADIRAANTPAAPKSLARTSSDVEADPNQAALDALDSPVPARKPERASTASSAEPSAFVAGVAGTLGGAEAPQDTAHASEETGEFEDFLAWVQGVKFAVEALVASETEADRAKYRRTLAYRLADRGVLAEAAHTLEGALTSAGRETTTVRADSLYLAEMRLQLGEREAASAIARALPADVATPAERVRAAIILGQTGFPALAQTLLEGAIPRLTDVERPAAQLLLARALWDQQRPDDARKITGALTSARNMPAGVLASATVLHADCLWSSGHVTEAEGYYRRATGYRLDDTEASWTSLQLGNVARREGRINDAIGHYRETVERWPDSYYATQADWFLRIAEETERLRASETERRRG